MALQELDLYIHYRPGKANTDADALSRVPIIRQNDDSVVPLTVLATIQADGRQPAKEGEDGC